MLYRLRCAEGFQLEAVSVYEKVNNSSSPPIQTCVVHFNFPRLGRQMQKCGKHFKRKGGWSSNFSSLNRFVVSPMGWSLTQFVMPYMTTFCLIFHQRQAIVLLNFSRNHSIAWITTLSTILFFIHPKNDCSFPILEISLLERKPSMVAMIHTFSM